MSVAKTLFEIIKISTWAISAVALFLLAFVLIEEKDSVSNSAEILQNGRILKTEETRTEGILDYLEIWVVHEGQFYICQVQSELAFCDMKQSRRASSWMDNEIE